MALNPVEPLIPEPPSRLGGIVMSQTWSQLTFLHWAVAPERVAGHLPPGVRPDTLDGMT
jgi:uncharacterized protein YqjF (DUF2071 family)